LPRRTWSGYADAAIYNAYMTRSAFAILAFAATIHAQPLTPEDFFGFTIGADRKLARYDKIVDYLKAVAAASERVRLRTIGPTTNSNPFVIVEISSAENIRNLDHLKSLERKLYFQNGAPTDAEREQIFKDGRSVVFISNNIHSTEIGASQMVVELVYHLATDNSAQTKKILDNTILVMEPSANPDGQIMVTDWYNKYLGTNFEGTNPPFLYHPYVGHDDNRDLFLLSQKESQMTAQVIWHDWFPSIWLDEHQQGNNGPRIFTMPATDPINPNVHPLIYRLNTIYGQAQAAALEAAGKEGIIYNATYTNFWEGAMAWSGWWHNEVGLLTEVASARIATPQIQRMAEVSSTSSVATGGRDENDFRRQAEARPDEPLPPPRDVNPRTEYPRPWLGGTWKLKDIVDYEMIATIALLEAAADRRETLLHEIYDINAATIDLGKKGELGFGDKDHAYAILIPVEGQHDANEVSELVEKLMLGGVEVSRAQADFTQDGTHYAAGTYVIPFTQVFARYAKDLIEKQTYPEVHRAPNAPAEAPYDVSAWSLGMQFGVKTVSAKTELPKDLKLARVTAKPAFILSAEKSGALTTFAYTGAESAVIVNRLLKDGAKVSIAKPSAPGAPAMVQVNARPEAWTKAVAGFEVDLKNSSTQPRELGAAMKTPRVGLYQSYTANMDEGWTRWILEHYEFGYTTLHNKDIQDGHLRDKFDAIVLPDQRAQDLVEGNHFASTVPEFKGGLEQKGVDALKDFVDHGGTLIALGEASNLLVDKWPLPVKELKRTLTREQHYAPGTIVNLQVDTTHPMGLGSAPDTYGFYINSPFFQLTEGFSSQKVSVVARYPNSGANASGWLRGENLMLGRAAVVAIETNPGKIVLFGIRPQHRAQTHATLPLLFNALYWSAEGDLTQQ
jgi:Zinc carboxypeptidase